MKPLNRKAYGSIPHIPGSRNDQSDKVINPGQVRIITEKARKNDVLIVQEKLDGTCVAICKIDGKIVPIGRAGYECRVSNQKQQQLFYDWVMEREALFNYVLDDGERVVGEWLAMAHGIKYKLKHEPFVAFDVMEGSERRPFNLFKLYVKALHLTTPHIYHIGHPLSMAEIIRCTSVSHHGGEFCEGVVLRVENNGKVDFLAKYVNPVHICGKYFNESELVWNIDI